ncbi:hypothetical protein LS68_002095 [Helicobacter sp. MIT 05-5293]|uniref:Uncharacterized protein n=1 Tax=uncultured Helicobacter sp. TaxID=175537 RepID=A0A650EL25_9HELI|nr:hypothetical protein [Helicobacter sp. MIT 05-5293]QGT49951.1 hypothetical protein Helico4rc_0700 [uncultured Helicobacter sp.]TLD81832.1 hypothetical protein LS68_002095 [Helicobacter sp. MIT 05-5293]
MGVRKISQKALEKLRLKNTPPTPNAYFEAFYEVAKAEGEKEFDWRLSWLKKFDKDTQNRLKNAKNPNEFIETLAKILKEHKESDITRHEHYLKALSQVLLSAITDVLSASAKNRYHVLFKQNALNSSKATQRLYRYWEAFRKSQLHTNVLKKIVGIIVKSLRISGFHKVANKDTSKILANLAMHPESLTDLRMLEYLETQLNLFSPQTLSEQKLDSEISENLSACESKTQTYCVVIFQVDYQDSQDSSFFEYVDAQEKAIKILKTMCVQKLGESILLKHQGNRFAFLFPFTTDAELLDKITPIQQQLQAQKFSYKGVMFSFRFSIKILQRKNFESFEKMSEELRKELC